MDAVALQVNPNAGYDTYSKILGMQQSQLGLQAARQQLQTGQYMQAQAQAKAQQDQQAAIEMQAGAKLLADPVGNGLVDSDGNPTSDAYQKIKRIMPITGDEHYTKMLSASKNKIEYANAYGLLNANQRSEVNSALAGIASDPKAKRGDLLSRLQTLRDDYKGTAASPYMNKIADNTAAGIKAITNEFGDGSEGAMHPKLQQYILGLSRGSIGNQAITGAGGVAAPSTANVDQGGQVLFGTQAPALAGGGFQQTGQGVQKTLAPTQQPGYVRQVAGITATVPGMVGGDIERKNTISSAVAPSNNAISTISEIRSLTAQIKQGSFNQQIIAAQQAAGDSSPEITARNLLKKDMANLKTSVGSAATTDAQRATVDSSFPDLDNVDVPTVNKALDRIEGTMRQNLARSRSMQDYLKKHPDAGGLQQADDRIMTDSDPLMHTYDALKTSAERVEFLKRHFDTKDQAEKFIHKKRAHSHVGGINE
jgi:hypothetical protein